MIFRDINKWNYSDEWWERCRRRLALVGRFDVQYHEPLLMIHEHVILHVQIHCCSILSFHLQVHCITFSVTSEQKSYSPTSFIFFSSKDIGSKNTTCYQPTPADWFLLSSNRSNCPQKTPITPYFAVILSFSWHFWIIYNLRTIIRAQRLWPWPLLLAGSGVMIYHSAVTYR